MVAIDQHQHLEREAHQWLARLTSGHATTADADAAKHWCDRSPAHARAFAEATLLWDTLEPVARQLASRNGNPSTIGPHARLGRRALLGGACAAAAAALGYLIVRPPLGLWPSAQAFLADYRTGTGDQRRIAIDGGISVELNTRTSLNIPKEAGDAHRIVLVSGEAAIETGGALAKPLMVSAGGGRVTATEAKFDIRCDGASTSVTCLQGTVTVDYRGRAAALQERQQVSYGDRGRGGDRGLGVPAAADAVAATAWREGRLVFHGVPLAEVIEEVNRYRPGPIILLNAALGRRSVDATFPLHRTDELVTLVREAYGAGAVTLPGGIVILS
jgi:transmembrane sensor